MEEYGEEEGADEGCSTVCWLVGVESGGGVEGNGVGRSGRTEESCRGGAVDLRGMKSWGHG